MTDSCNTPGGISEKKAGGSIIRRALPKVLDRFTLQLHKRPTVGLALMLAIGVAAILWHLSRLSLNLIESAALQGASLHSDSLAEFRTLYTSEVVDRLRSHGIEVTHDYLTKEGAIPLPATLSMELGKRIGEKGSGMQARLYSDYPFPWRTDGGPRDDFEREALRQLRQHPEQPFSRFQVFQGRWSLRYATADRMQAGCVSCHNSHPDSPKTDWKAGDVRGVLEVIRPLDSLVAQIRKGLLGTFALMATITVCGLFVLGMVIGRLRRTSRELDQHTSELEREITERKQAEEALREKEDESRDLVEHSQVLMCTHDLEGRLLSVNQAVERALGYDRSVILKTPMREILAPEAGDPFDGYLAEIRRHGVARGVMVVLNRAGERRLWEYHNTLRTEGVPVPIVRGVAHDVTERTRASEALRESEARFKELTEGTQAIPWEADATTWRFTYVGPQAAAILGYPTEEWYRDGFWVEHIHPEDREWAVNFCKESSEKLEEYKFEYRMLASNGRTVWLRDLVSVAREEGRQKLLRGMMLDITERKGAEEALRESEGKYRDLVETSNDLICSVDAEGRWTFLNRGATTRTLWYAPEEMLGRPFTDFLLPERLEQDVEALERVMAGEPRFQHETVLLRKDGTPVHMSFNAIVLRDPDGKAVGATGIGTDITERKGLEEQLRQALKMEAIGRLAGGVAHDFNNLLNGIIGFTELTLRELPEGSRGKGYLSRVPGMGRQAADLVGQLLTFTRKAPLERKPLDLNLMLRETVGLLERTLPASLALRMEPSPKPLLVHADRAQVQQIFLNLATNARDAMPQGGTLTIRSARVTFDEQGASAHSERRPGAFACLTVADTGAGIPPAIRDRIFEPFFTTKGPGEGTGLGLASVYGAVHQHEGWLEVESTDGRGSSFHVFLPLVPEVDAAAVKPMVPFLRGDETVLLVEDNQVVRELIREVLQVNGYTVLEARNGGEARSLAERHLGPLHLVVTDVVMPRMGGRELAEKLRPLRPEMRVLYVSGYGDEETVQGEPPGRAGHLQKPFSPDELARKVREVLDAPQ